MNEQIKYKYVKMEVEQFAMFEENIPLETNDVQFQTGVQFSFDKDNSILCSKVVVTISQDNNPIMKIDLNNYFEIASESISNLMQEEKLVFSPPILVQFASLGYGAIRGIMYTKTMGTALSTFILPPIYLGNMIDKAFVVRCI